MHIETAKFETEMEATAYIGGIIALSDLVLDYAGMSISTTEPELINGKYVVSVDSVEDEDEGEDDTGEND